MATIVVAGVMILSACTSSGEVQQTVTITQDPHVTQVTAPILTDQPTTTPPAEPTELEGSWGWMQDEQIQANEPKQSRVHFRPKEYWPAHAQVHVEATLKGVNYGSGWGSQNIVCEFEMCNRKYNYCNSKQYWGVRINNNGEFIHVNKQTEAAGLLGKADVSHGCINMGMRDGEQFFNMVYYGVPVDVEGTGVKMGYGEYVWDWAVSWEDWKSFSAL